MWAGLWAAELLGPKRISWVRAILEQCRDRWIAWSRFWQTWRPKFQVGSYHQHQSGWRGKSLPYYLPNNSSPSPPSFLCCLNIQWRQPLGWVILPLNTCCGFFSPATATDLVKTSSTPAWQPYHETMTNCNSMRVGNTIIQHIFAINFLPLPITVAPNVPSMCPLS